MNDIGPEGFVAVRLGPILAMGVKAAHIFAGACAVGELAFLSRAAIMHNYRRPDEVYRRQRFVQGEASAEVDTPER